MLPFAIVEFVESKSVSVIPSSWFCGEEEDRCYWPSRISDTMKITKMVSKQSDPDTTWPVFQVRVLGKAGDYSRARQKAILGEDTSNIDTDVEEQPRKRRKNSKYILSSDESDSEPTATPASSNRCELPVPPAPPTLAEMATHSTNSSPSTSRQSSFSSSPSSNLLRSNVHPSLPTSLGNSTPQGGKSSLQRMRDSSDSSPDIREQQRSGAVQADSAPVNNAVLRKILSVLEGIKQTQRIHSAQFQLILRQGEVSGAAAADFTMPEGITFPVSSNEELMAFDERLQDEAFKKGLVVFLGDMGGRTLEETVKRIMAHVLSDEFATNCNISGRNKKTAFGKTLLFDVVYRAVKRNPKSSSNTRKDVETSIAKWLIGSRDRCGARRGRLGGVGAMTTVTDVEGN